MYFPYLESHRNRENTVKFSKSTVTPHSFCIPIPLSFEILSGMRFTSQSRSKRRCGTESLDISGSTDRSRGSRSQRHVVFAPSNSRTEFSQIECRENRRDEMINHGQVSLMLRSKYELRVTVSRDAYVECIIRHVRSGTRRAVNCHKQLLAARRVEKSRTD